MNTRDLITLLLLGPTSACGMYYVNPPPPPNATLWCVEAVGANGTRTAGGADVTITKGGDWITGCVPMCDDDDAIMDLGLDGMIPMGDPLEPQWNALKAEVRGEANTDCELRVDALELAGGAINFNGMIDVTCQEAADLRDPYEGSMTFSSDCGAGDTGGSETSPAVGPDIYGLTSYDQIRSCTTNTSARTITCNLDKDFIHDLVADVTLIFSDDASLASVISPSGYKLTTCASTSLLYALGLRVNDVITKIDEFPFATMADGNRVLGNLGQSSYSGTPAKATFVRSGNTWTITVNRTNFVNYP